MSLPSNPVHGTLASLNGNDFTFDSDINAWILLKSSQNKKVQSEIDSDINFRLDSELNVIRLTANSSGFPVGAVIPFATSNLAPGFLLADGSSFNTLTYPDLYDYLDSEVLPDYTNRTFGYKQYNYGDWGDIQNNPNVYFGIASYNGAGLVLDSEIVAAAVQEKTADFDSDTNSLQNEINELKADLAQAISDRVFTDNTLSSRLDGHDSDLDLRGRFYVQSSVPSGGPNSGWVNTNNMKLNVWDETTDTWVEVVT